MDLTKDPGTLDDDALLRALSDGVHPGIRARVEYWYDAAETLAGPALDEAHDAGYDKACAELEPYRAAWDELFSTWQEYCADGVWPGAGPDDEHLLRVMAYDMQRGAEALQLVRDIAAGKFADPAAEARAFLKDEANG